MKRTYDNAMQGPATTAGQISTGQTATKESIYMNTNMVNVQREDHTPQHGIVSNFNQSRILPIVGKTSRAEIALKSADVQTKALPMFQPQVALGQDINRLIYETGLSAVWKNSMLTLPPDGVSLNTLLFEGNVTYPSFPPGSSVFITADGDNSYFGESTFSNSWQAYLPFIDAYGVTGALNLFPMEQVVNTQLSVLFNYWKDVITGPSLGAIRSPLKSTCLTPVLVGSESEHILFTSVLPSLGQFPYSYLVAVRDTSGFKVGDRIRFFGTQLVGDSLKPLEDVFSTVLDITTYDTQNTDVTSSHLPALVLSAENSGSSSGTYQVFAMSSFYNSGAGTVSWSSLQYPGQGLPDTFEIGSSILITNTNYNELNGVFVIKNITGSGNDTTIIIDAPAGLPYPMNSSSGVLSDYNVTPPPAIQGGYVINQTVKNGGHIEFLTDEYEFAPLILDGTNEPYNGFLTLKYDKLALPIPIYDQGFWRGSRMNGQVFEDYQPLQCAVQITINSLEGAANPALFSFYAKIFNGYYSITKRPDGSTFVLSPLSRAIPLGTTFDLTSPQITFTMQLAPNFYTFDTKADEIIDLELTSRKYDFMQAIGFVPTESIPIQSPTYPPTASVPKNTWSRAYQVNWDFSAYRNIEWVPQDTISPLPRVPEFQQDFGFDNGSSTYYNVYEFNKFLNDCVNPSIERCINDVTYEVPAIEAGSLNFQLAYAFNAYKQLFMNDPINYVWNATTTYELGDLAIVSATNKSWAFMCAVQSTTQKLPESPKSNRVWYFLGLTPNFIVLPSGSFVPYELALSKTSINSSLSYLMSAKVYPVQPIFSSDTVTAYVTPGLNSGQPQLQSNGFYYASGTLKLTFDLDITVPLDPTIWVIGASIQVYGQDPRITGVYTILAIPGSGIERDFIVHAPAGLPFPMPSSPSTIFLVGPGGSGNPPTTTQLIPIPEFKTVAPVFHYNELTLLSSIKYDGYAFGTSSLDSTSLNSKAIALFDYARTSWGNQGYENANEWMTFESNSAFKFLLDNFPSSSVFYEDTLSELRSGGQQYPLITYWVWDNTSSFDPRKEASPFYEIYQSSESMSSCMSPVQSIVVVSDNIPVLEELASPVNYLIDSDSTSFTNRSETVGLTQKIIGEFTLPSTAPYNSRSIVKYDTEELKFYSLLDTKLFKQLEYSLYYRHRIAQQLVPLIISNYGSVNIKFVFRPIS